MSFSVASYPDDPLLQPSVERFMQVSGGRTFSSGDIDLAHSLKRCLPDMISSAGKAGSDAIASVPPQCIAPTLVTEPQRERWRLGSHPMASS